MCVAIYRPGNAKMPSLETLKKCWDANNNGAGFARRGEFKGGKGNTYIIEIRKGFMTWEAFEEAYNKYLKDFEGDTFIHFRITTHGGTCEGNTHPFPISADTNLLKTTWVVANDVLMHNGILGVTPSEDKISDTMELCKRMYRSDLSIPQAFDLLEGMLSGSRLAAMDKDGVYLAGDWSDVDGCKFSNLIWQRPAYAGWGGYCNNYGYECGKHGYNYQTAYDYDYEDYPVGVTKREAELLKEGKCPYCGESVTEYKHTWECDFCETVFEKPKWVKK